MIARLWRSARGGTAVEFALVAPTFLIFLFLILDGGRMLFAKQALNELASAAARCAALKAPGCITDSAIQTWAVNRGARRSALVLATSDVTPLASCTGRTGSWEQVTIRLTYPKGALNLLPQSTVPAQLTSISCFPVAS